MEYRWFTRCKSRLNSLKKQKYIKKPKNLADLRQKPQLHNAVIDKEQMLSFVLGL